jgi:hypothetical protein
MNKIKKGDEVIVTTGKDKGRRGTVLRVLDDGRVLVEGINLAKKHIKPNPNVGEPGGNKKFYDLMPLFIIRDRAVFARELPIEELGMKIAFRKIDPETGKLDIAISERKDNKREFIIMKAIVFPYINLLWTGCILLIIGSTMAIRKRFSDLARMRKAGVK